MSVPKTILVAYDDPASGTLARAADLAQALGSKLLVTNVTAPDEPSRRDEAVGPSRKKLAEAEALLAERGLEAELVAAVGAPADEIVQLAADRGVDLIVIGTRRKGLLERLVEGSVAQGVLRRARCDVMVVH